MGLRHGYGHAALNAGVLVMDLDRMRRDDFTTDYLGWVERYGFHDQDTMLAYVGPDRTVLEPRWNAMPALEDVPDPSLIHWASFGKPWDDQLTFEQERWRDLRRHVRARAGDPPSGAGATSAGTGRLDAPIQIGPVTTPLAPAIERVIEDVRAEHLSYLGAANLRTLAATVAGHRSGRDRGADRRMRHGPRRLGHRHGRGEAPDAADEGLRRVRDDPATGREGRRRRPRALRDDRQRRRDGDRRRDVLRLQRRPARPR